MELFCFSDTWLAGLLIAQALGEWTTIGLLRSGSTQSIGFVLSRFWNRDRVAKSKFAEFPDFGEAGEGYTSTRTMAAKVAFRNIRLKEFN